MESNLAVKDPVKIHCKKTMMQALKIKKVSLEEFET